MKVFVAAMFIHSLKSKNCTFFNILPLTAKISLLFSVIKNVIVIMCEKLSGGFKIVSGDFFFHTKRWC